MTKTSKDSKTWHLSRDKEEATASEFEFALWRVFYGFLRWQEDCQSYICGGNLNAYEIALLHIIRMKERPKTIYEVSRLLNRDDPNNIQYSLKKLAKMGLIEQVNSVENKKQASYQITKAGIENTSKFRDAKREILIDLFNKFLTEEEIKNATDTLMKVKGIYDEASRISHLYDEKC